MSDHGFSVCAPAGVSPRVIDAPHIPWHDKCGTRWLPKYSPPPPWRVFWDEIDEIDDVCTWCNQHLPQFIEFWETTCRDGAFDYCAASGERVDE